MFKSILVPVDFGPAAETALKTALILAGDADARIHLVSVLPDYGYGIVAQYFAPDAQEKAKEEVLIRLREHAAKLGGGNKVGEIIVRHGKIYEEILNAAKGCGADLIVIAGRSGEKIGPFLMGGNSEKVVRYATCSVLVIKDGT